VAGEPGGYGNASSKNRPIRRFRRRLKTTWPKSRHEDSGASVTTGEPSGKEYARFTGLDRGSVVHVPARDRFFASSSHSRCNPLVVESAIGATAAVAGGFG